MKTKTNKTALIPKLRFPEFKNSGEWEVKKIKNIAEVVIGGTPSTKVKEYWNGDIPWINSGKIRDDIITEPSKFITDKGLKKSNLTLMPKDTTVLAMTGATLGKVGFLNFESTGNQSVAGFLDLKNVFPKFFFYSLFSIKQQIYSMAGGAAQVGINKSSIENLKLPLPTLPEQQKIADFLSNLDEWLAAEEEKLTLLETYKKGLLQNLFPAEGETTPRLRFPEFQNSGEWEFLNGNILFESISNKNHNGNLPVLAITQEKGAIPRDEIDYTVIVSKKSIENYKVVEKGDFIISLRSFQGGIEYSQFKGLCSPAYIILRKKKTLNDIFYKFYFKTNRYILELNKNLEGIRDGKMISYKQFSEIKIPYPTLPEQQKIADCLSALDEQIEAQRQKVEQLREHKKGLLQGLFPQLSEL